jgi:hypothetical protein
VLASLASPTIRCWKLPWSWSHRAEDEYFIEKKLYPNIDFYSGITLKALGFPTTMFTVLFALARTVGWIAQWKEMIEDPSSASAARASSTPGHAAARLRAGVA